MDGVILDLREVERALVINAQARLLLLQLGILILQRRDLRRRLRELHARDQRHDDQHGGNGKAEHGQRGDRLLGGGNGLRDDGLRRPGSVRHLDRRTVPVFFGSRAVQVIRRVAVHGRGIAFF